MKAHYMFGPKRIEYEEVNFFTYCYWHLNIYEFLGGDLPLSDQRYSCGRQMIFGPAKFTVNTFWTTTPAAVIGF
jgi:hypothetical protein